MNKPLKQAPEPSTSNERLRYLRETLKMSMEAFAHVTGMSRSHISNIENGRRDITIELMSFLNETYGVSMDWLILGKGTMLPAGELAEHSKAIDLLRKEGFEVIPPGPNAFNTMQRPLADFEIAAQVNAQVNAQVTAPDKTFGTKKADSPPKLALGRGPQVLVVTTEPGGTENIALVSTRVAAGYAAGGFIEPEFMRQLPTFSLPDAAYRNGTFRAFQVTGDSMQSTLHEGDWVICRFVEHWATGIQDTFVYVVVTDEQPVIKRVLNRLTERGQLTLQSDNPAYPTQFLDGERVREVWRAVGRLSRQFTNPRYDLIQEVSRSRADIDELMQRLDTLEQRPGRQNRPKKPH